MRTQMHRVSFFPLVLIFLFLWIINESPAQVLHLSVDKMTQKSEIIVTGKVVDKVCEWNQEKDKILTRVTVQVDQIHKGKGLAESLVVTHLGGEIGEVGEYYSGTPRFNEDEEVFLFLRKDGKGSLRVVGSNQGKYTITRDVETGNRIIMNHKTLDAFSSQIREIVARQKLE